MVNILMFDKNLVKLECRLVSLIFDDSQTHKIALNSPEIRM